MPEEALKYVNVDIWQVLYKIEGCPINYTFSIGSDLVRSRLGYVHYTFRFITADYHHNVFKLNRFSIETGKFSNFFHQGEVWFFFADQM